MSNFYNMKIEITNDQSLDSIVIELKRLGYWISSMACDPNQVWCFEDGRVLIVEGKPYWSFTQCIDTTLSDLKDVL